MREKKNKNDNVNDVNGKRDKWKWRSISETMKFAV